MDGYKGPLGELPNMRWCGETNRYYAAKDWVPYQAESAQSRSATFADIDRILKRPVDKRIVETLPRLNKRGRAQSVECSICYKSSVHHTMDPRMRFVSLPCSHAFHLYCIDEWLVKRNGSCPLCRQAVDISLETAAKSFMTTQ
jgi:hypothetical protein